MNTEISFQKSGPRETARYVSAYPVAHQSVLHSALGARNAWR